jgi:hypothetical protein
MKSVNCLFQSHNNPFLYNLGLTSLLSTQPSRCFKVIPFNNLELFKSFLYTIYMNQRHLSQTKKQFGLTQQNILELSLGVVSYTLLSRRIEDIQNIPFCFWCNTSLNKLNLFELLN